MYMIIHGNIVNYKKWKPIEKKKKKKKKKKTEK